LLGSEQFVKAESGNGWWARSLAIEWHPNEEDEVKIRRRFVWASFYFIFYFFLKMAFFNWNGKPKMPIIMEGKNRRKKLKVARDWHIYR
jgi:hypothetical protein